MILLLALAGFTLFIILHITQTKLAGIKFGDDIKLLQKNRFVQTKNDYLMLLQKGAFGFLLGIVTHHAILST